MSSRPPDRPAQPYLFDDGSNSVVIDGPVFVQARRGPLTRDAVDRLVAAARSFLTSRKGRVAAIAILERGAAVPDEDVRAHQQKGMSALLDDERVLVAGVVLGEDTGATLRRAVTRSVAHGNRRKRTFQDVGDAVRWVAGELALDAGDVYAIVERARKRAKPTAG